MLTVVSVEVDCYAPHSSVPLLNKKKRPLTRKLWFVYIWSPSLAGLAVNQTHTQTHTNPPTQSLEC